MPILEKTRILMVHLSTLNKSTTSEGLPLNLDTNTTTDEPTHLPLGHEWFKPHNNVNKNVFKRGRGQKESFHNQNRVLWRAGGSTRTVLIEFAGVSNNRVLRRVGGSTIMCSTELAWVYNNRVLRKVGVLTRTVFNGVWVSLQ